MFSDVCAQACYRSSREEAACESAFAEAVRWQALERTKARRGAVPCVGLTACMWSGISHLLKPLKVSVVSVV
jgi:hypothetical protein